LWYSKWTVDTDEFVLVWLGLGNRPNATLKAHTSAGTGANNGKPFPDYYTRALDVVYDLGSHTGV
jgi:hypothetical protein